METVKHWSSRSEESLVLSVATDFVAQIETELEEQHLERAALAKAAKVSPGRVSQVLNDPSSMNLRSIVKYTRAVNRKVAVVVYEDELDRNHDMGPVSATVFRAAWYRLGSPRNLFQIYGVQAAIPSANITQQYRVEDIGHKPLDLIELTTQYAFLSNQINQPGVNYAQNI